MRDKDTIILENIYFFIVEGKKETIDFLEKNGADQDIISFFTKQDNKGNPIFPTDHVVTLFNWTKNNSIKKEDIEKDYSDFKKYFPNKSLNDFGDYIDFSEQVHAKVGEKTFAQRNKEDTNDISADNQDVLVDDENVLIVKGDDEHKCVKYGKDYSFCISRPYGGNMYGNYRLTKASTFYFIYFKKVSKKDPKHIMVLDRTKDGWEWTFGDNQTKVIEGNWNEIAETFSVLKKYESIFINKPLNDEEKNYQEKLAIFARNPNKKDFEDFSYKEKADVLKFGMVIPQDLFDSLNKFLRNEYISVGPQISTDIFNELKDNEKERYIKVRKTVLDQTPPKTLIDVEIIKNDTALYEKYIKPEEIEYQSFLKKYGQLEDINDDLIFDLKYYPLNLPKLKTCKGHIDASNATTIDLSNLQECGGYIFLSNAITIDLSNLETCGRYIDASNATIIDLSNLKICGVSISVPNAITIDLSNLQECGGSIEARNATIVDLSNLQECGGVIDASNASTIDLSNLEICKGHIDASNATTIDLSNLQECRGIINVPKAPTINLSNLQTCGDNIYLDSALTVDLSNLKTCRGDIYANNASTVDLSNLQLCEGDIHFDKAKKIIIQKPLLDKLKNVPKDCKIIHPENSKIISTESFKKYFYFNL